MQRKLIHSFGSADKTLMPRQDFFEPGEPLSRKALERLPVSLLGRDCKMESVKHCVYNQTTECFLGLEVDAADFSEALLEDRLPALTPESGAGLWMIPFRGIPPARVRLPLDLIYLDQRCCVIEVVESFPQARVSASSRPATSVLVLPAHSIQSSQTKAGDQLVLCPASEMVNHLNPRSSSSDIGYVDEDDFAMPNADRAPASGGTVTAQSSATAAPAPAGRQTQPAEEEPKKRGWLGRLFSLGPREPDDARKASRRTIPGLFAFFWTGATPEPNAVRDISSSGLYVITEERWYPDTVIRMTLSKMNSRGNRAERSISVLARAVRWGNDGVGLQFVLPKAQAAQNGQPEGGANREQLDEFLTWLKTP